MKNNQNFLWAVFFLPVLPLAGYTVYSGLVVGEMELPGGFRFTFRERKNGGTSEASDQALEDLSETELSQRQTELEERFNELERQSEADESSQSLPDTELTDIDLSGDWYSQAGLWYQIVQNGSFLTIQEVSPAYGITAVGEGQIQGQSVLIDYQTAAYTQGVADLTLSPDGQSLSGSFRDNFSGYTVPVLLSRQ